MVLLLSHVSRVCGPVTVVYDGSPAGEKALAAAGELVRALSSALTVFCLAETRQGAGELVQKACAALGDMGVDLHSLGGGDIPNIERRARSTGANLVVVPAGSPTLPVASVEKVVRDFFGPVMIVGSGEDRSNSDVAQ